MEPMEPMEPMEIDTIGRHANGREKRPCCRLVALVLLCLVLPACAHHPAARKVDIGGFRLLVRCAGQGHPTVLMDSGLGDTLESWSEVFPQVQVFTTVCVYDRAGLGGSDPGPTPRTSQRIVDELHALITNAHIDGPFILVGHSFGGLNIRLFAREHPAEAVGMVLVEATHEDYPAKEKTARPIAETRKLENSFGLATPAAQSEFKSLSQSAEEVRTSPPLPDIPLIVITAGRRGEAEPLRQIWMDLQRDLVTKAPNARQVLAEHSGHYVQFDEPEVIVSAIHELVESGRR